MKILLHTIVEYCLIYYLLIMYSPEVTTSGIVVSIITHQSQSTTGEIQEQHQLKSQACLPAFIEIVTASSVI